MAATTESIRSKHKIENKETKEAHDIVPAKDRQGYRRLNEFTDFADVTHAFMFRIPADALYVNKVDVAREVIQTREPDPLYLATYHIALRKGEFHAQVDQALREIYQLLLGYGPDAYIVKEENTFYLASRTIRNFMHSFENYDLFSHGIFKKSNSEKMTLKGLASIVAISYFFGETDIHSKNWGIQEQENSNTLRAYKIDCADELDCKVLLTPITIEDIQLLAMKCVYSEKPLSDKDEIEEYSFGISPLIIDSPEFQEELMGMLKIIAETSFEKIRQILIRNISTDASYSTAWMIEKMQYLIEKGPEKLIKEAGKTLEECDQLLKEISEFCVAAGDILKKEEKHDLNFILTLLETRQLALREVSDIKPIKIFKMLTAYDAILNGHASNQRDSSERENESINPMQSSYRSYQGYK